MFWTAAFVFFASAAVVSALLMMFTKSAVKSVFLMAVAMAAAGAAPMMMNLRALAALQAAICLTLSFALFVIIVHSVPETVKARAATPKYFKLLACIAAVLIVVRLLSLAADLRRNMTAVDFSGTGLQTFSDALSGGFSYQLALAALIIVSAAVGASSLLFKRRHGK